VSSIVGEGGAYASEVAGRGGTAAAEGIARRYIEDDAAAVVRDLRRWFQTWALEVHQQLVSQLGEDAIVTEASLDLFIADTSSSAVSQAIQTIDRQWRLGLGLAAGRWDAPPPEDSRSWALRDVRVALGETMFSPGEFGLCLVSAESGSLKTVWKKSGIRKLLLNEEILAIISVLSFAGVSGPMLAKHLAVHRTDGTKCELNITGTDLPAAQRDRLVREIGEVPEDCTIKIELTTASNQKAILTLPPPPPARPSRHGKFTL
jgi:hypothetical protein